MAWQLRAGTNHWLGTIIKWQLAAGWQLAPIATCGRLTNHYLVPNTLFITGTVPEIPGTWHCTGLPYLVPT